MRAGPWPGQGPKPLFGAQAAAWTGQWAGSPPAPSPPRRNRCRRAPRTGPQRTSRSRDRVADARLGRHPARAHRAAAAPAGGAAAARAGPGRGARAGACLRGVPHRPAPGRGRPAAAPARRRARPRGRRRRRRRAGPTAHAVRGRATGSASPGCAAPAGPAASAGAAARTCARSSRFTGWDADGGYAEYAVGAGGLRLPAARRLRRRARRRRCCAPASSATGRCGAPSCRPAAGSASTASAPAPTSPRRSRSPRAPRCTS